jgi:hypothetical protein
MDFTAILQTPFVKKKSVAHKSKSSRYQLIEGELFFLD